MTSAGNLHIGGLVGIGTTNPTASLTVGDGTDHESIEINKGTSETATLSFLNAGSAKVYFQADGNEHLRIATNNTQRMSILENGNVGINETTPTEKLHVDGNLKVTGSVIIGSTGATTISDLALMILMFFSSGKVNTIKMVVTMIHQINTLTHNLCYADATSPWNKSSVATKSCEDLTTLVGTATFNTTYKKSKSWNWHYMLGLKNTDRITGSPLPTNYMRIKMPVYYTAGASDHHVFYLKTRMDINQGYQVCVANEAGTPQKRAGCYHKKLWRRKHKRCWGWAKKLQCNAGS